jgi:hypothetical protein
VAPLARLEHATFWSATKRSNPLSYRGKGEWYFNADLERGQVQVIAVQVIAKVSVKL